MTIGPEPITRTEPSSGERDLGTLVSLHQALPADVVAPGPRLRPVRLVARRIAGVVAEHGLALLRGVEATGLDGQDIPAGPGGSQHDDPFAGADLEGDLPEARDPRARLERLGASQLVGIGGEPFLSHEEAHFLGHGVLEQIHGQNPDVPFRESGRGRLVVAEPRLPAREDDDGPHHRPDHRGSQDGHHDLHAVSISARNRSNRYRESCGPGAASGWYWTENAGTSSSRSPSSVPSFRFQCVSAARPKAVFTDPSGWPPMGVQPFGSTAKPWLWDVTSTRPVSSLRTGWLAPRCPNASLYVVPPRARLMIWWPRQIPNTGMLPSRAVVISTAYRVAAGSPGPLERNTPS